MLQAFRVHLDVVEHHKDDSNNLFLVEVVQNLADPLNNPQVVVRKAPDRKRVISQNPKSAADIVCNLSLLQAVLLQKPSHQLEALSVNKVPSQLVSLDHVHQTVGKGMFGQHRSQLLFGLRFVLLTDEHILLLKQIVHEVLCSDRTLFELIGFDQHSKCMGCEVTMEFLVDFVALGEETIKNADQVQLALSVGGALN